MSNWFSGITEGIAVSIEHIAGGLGSILDKVTALGDIVRDSFTNLRDAALEKAGEILAWTQEIRQLFIDKFKEMMDAFVGNWLKFFTWADKVREDLFNLPQFIFNKMKELFEMFFLPDEEATNYKLEALREKFAFVDSVTGLGEHLVGFLQSAAGRRAPVITIDLSSYAGKYSYGSGVVTMDFSWYAKYKPNVDIIVAGIIYTSWGWHLYKRLPELISGQGMTTAHIIDLARRE